MGFIDGIRKYAYQTYVDKMDKWLNKDHEYSTPDDSEEDATTKQDYITKVVCGKPLRDTKCLFVTEMNDFYTDAQLNTIYHSADEYRNAIKKYGLIYKSQKFQNADTPQKLLDYAKDWIKNNYHGGITSFTVTALDMHTLGAEVDQYLVGQRVNVVYKDPALQNETTQTLTVISAEYDLLNPDKNNYKIGIPDVTLNKVYGDTTKSGGGGGGGKPKDEADDDTQSQVDQLIDEASQNLDEMTEQQWATFRKLVKDGDMEGALAQLTTPGEADETSNWNYGVTADVFKGTIFHSTIARITQQLESKLIKCTDGIDTVGVSSVNINNGNKVNTKDLEASDTVKGANGEFDALKVDGKSVQWKTENGHLVMYFNGQRFDLTGGN